MTLLFILGVLTGIVSCVTTYWVISRKTNWDDWTDANYLKIATLWGALISILLFGNLAREAVVYGFLANLFLGPVGALIIWVFESIKDFIGKLFQRFMNSRKGKLDEDKS